MIDPIPILILSGLFWLGWRLLTLGKGRRKPPSAGQVRNRFGKVPPVVRLDDKAAEDKRREAWAVDQAAGPDRPAPPMRLRLTFESLGGEISQRDVRAIRYSHDPKTGAGVLQAFCELRQQQRTFRFSGVRKAIDLETGELVQSIGAHLDAAFEATPAGAAERFFAENESALHCMFVLAKADGAFRAKEGAVIAAWLAQHGLLDADAAAALNKLLRLLDASEQGFRKSVRRLADEGRPADYVASVWRALQDIVQSDKTIKGAETDLLEYAGKCWGMVGLGLL